MSNIKIKLNHRRWLVLHQYIIAKIPGMHQHGNFSNKLLGVELLSLASKIHNKTFLTNGGLLSISMKPAESLALLITILEDTDPATAIHRRDFQEVTNHLHQKFI